MSKLVSLALVALAAISAVSGSPLKVSPAISLLFPIYPQTFHSPIILTSRRELVWYLLPPSRPCPNPPPPHRLQAMMMIVMAITRMMTTATTMLIASMRSCIPPFPVVLPFRVPSQLPLRFQLPLPSQLPLPTLPSLPRPPMSALHPNLTPADSKYTFCGMFSAFPHPNFSLTWYTQDGNAGACGVKHSDSDLIAALDSRTYSQSYCGKKIRVSWGGKSVDVTVADECPGCYNAASVDLSTAAFQSLASLDVGVLTGGKCSKRPSRFCLLKVVLYHLATWTLL